MGKFKPAGRKKSARKQRANAVGCVALLVVLFLLMFVLIYFTVQQGGK